MAYSSLTDSRRKARIVHTAQGAFLVACCYPFMVIGVFLAVDRWTARDAWKPRPVPPHAPRNWERPFTSRYFR